MTTHPFLSLLLFLVAVVLAALALGRLQARGRTRAMQGAAREIGFAFEGENWSDPNQAPQLESDLFAGSGKWSNVMTGNVSGLRTSLFDYSCSLRYEARPIYTQTVAAFSKELLLPLFAVYPDSASDPIRTLSHFRENEMNFDFSERYVLRGPAQDKLRELFNPRLTSALISFTPEDHWHIEGMGTTLILYRIGVIVRAHEMPAFLQQTSLIAKTFFDLCGLKKPVA